MLCDARSGPPSRGSSGVAAAAEGAAVGHRMVRPGGGTRSTSPGSQHHSPPPGAAPQAAAAAAAGGGAARVALTPRGAPRACRSSVTGAAALQHGGHSRAALVACARPFRAQALEAAQQAKLAEAAGFVHARTSTSRPPRPQAPPKEPQAARPGQRQKRRTAPPVHTTTGPPPDSSVPSAWRAQFELSPGDALLGGGAFAKVFRVLERSSGAAFAMKVMNRPNFAMRGIGAQVDAEIDAMRRAVRSRQGCRHVLRLADVVEEKDYVYLRLELCACDLLRYTSMQPDGRLCEAEARKYAAQLMAGISDLHALGVLHRDLKPENLLLTEDACLKIADFGWCADVRDSPCSLAGTLQYMAPEMLEGEVQTEAVDVWSSGITVWQLLVGRPFLSTYLGPGATEVSHTDPHQSTNLRTAWLLDEIRGKCPPTEDLRPEQVNETCWDLLKGMLHHSVLDRVSTAEALRHPWLEEPTRREEWAAVVAVPAPEAWSVPLPATAEPLAPRGPVRGPRELSQELLEPPPAVLRREPRLALRPCEIMTLEQTMPMLAMGRRSETAPQVLQEPSDKDRSISEDASTASGGSPRQVLSKASSQAAEPPSPRSLAPGAGPVGQAVHRWRTNESSGGELPDGQRPRSPVLVERHRSPLPAGAARGDRFEHRSPSGPGIVGARQGAGGRRASIACPSEAREQQRLLAATTAAASGVASATTVVSGGRPGAVGAAPEVRRHCSPPGRHGPCHALTAAPGVRAAGHCGAPGSCVGVFAHSGPSDLSRSMPAGGSKQVELGEVMVLAASSVKFPPQQVLMRPWLCPGGVRLSPSPLAAGPGAASGPAPAPRRLAAAAPVARSSATSPAPSPSPMPTAAERGRLSPRLCTGRVTAL